ncbi:MAG: M18 family aminopeptidase [Lachnospiraceae bacterium]|nr:M18 family aminopeptidase [Lachnospiraceae bacterium]
MTTEQKYLSSANYLLERIVTSTSPFHTVLTAGEDLDAAGFVSLDFNRDWELEYGGKYYVTVYDSTLIAFTVGDSMADEGNLRLAMAHTDFPCFKLKPSPEMKQNGYGRLNVEAYGGMLNYSWLDRPLSIAGKVALKGEDAFHPEVRFVDFARPVATIPSLAIHMNREANKGVEFNLQKDMLPIVDILEESLGDEAFFCAALAEECGADPEEILDFELYLYQCEKGEIIGLNETMISSPRLDNITSVTACIKGLIQAQRGTGINMAVLFDHEEVGSRSKQGAAGSALPYVIERIYLALGLTRDRYLKDITDGFALSVDVAHAMHTNSPEKNDPTHPVKMNGGVAIKIAARQSYVYSCESVAAVQALCAMADVPCQKFVNRSDMPGGGTLGSIAASYLPMQMQDVGVAMLAMHSARELMGVKDQYYLEQLVMCLFGFK